MQTPAQAPVPGNPPSMEGAPEVPPPPKPSASSRSSSQKWVKDILVPILCAVIGAAAVWFTKEPKVIQILEIKKPFGSYDVAASGILYFSEDQQGAMANFANEQGLGKKAFDSDHYLRARILHQLNRVSEAETEYRAAGEYPNAKYLLALTLLARHSDEEACSVLEQVLKSNPENGPAMYYRGVCLIKLQQYTAAKQTLLQVIERHPEMLGAYHNLGVSDMHLRNDADALKSFEVVTIANPTFAQSWFDKGVVLYRLNRKTDALAAIKTAVAIDSSVRKQLEDSEHLPMQVDPEVGKEIKALVAPAHSRT